MYHSWPYDFAYISKGIAVKFLGHHMSSLMTKSTKWHVHPAKTQIFISRLIWVFAGCTFILLVLSWGGSYELQHNKTIKITCAHRRLRSACACLQSDQCLHCPHEEALGPWLSIECTVKTDQIGWMPRLLSRCWAHRSFCWFCCALPPI